MSVKVNNDTANKKKKSIWLCLYFISYSQMYIKNIEEDLLKVLDGPVRNC